MAGTEMTQMLARHLEERFGKVWIHPRGPRAFGKLDLPSHKVAVNGDYPDLLCLTNDDRIVAVVMELLQPDPIRGLGRAVLFKGAVHEVVLTSDYETCERFRDAILGSGVGVCSVGPGPKVSVELPAKHSRKVNLFPQHQDILRELTILSQRKVRRRFTALGFDHPLHYAAPVLAIRPQSPQPKQEVASLLLERWGFGGPQTEAWWNCLYGARFLGLVREQEEEGDLLELTELGQQVRASLLSQFSAAELKDLTEQTPPLIDLAPTVALIMRGLYFVEPDAGLIINLLTSFEKPVVPVIRMLNLSIQRFPNAAMNLFVKAESQEDFARSWREGRLLDMVKPHFTREMIHPGMIGPFKRQLVHLGVLTADTPVCPNPVDYDPSKDVWIRRI